MTALHDPTRRPLPDAALDQLLREARTYPAWLDIPVDDDTLHRVYDLMKWGPTSGNLTPARFVFLRSRAAKERLRPALAPGNVEKTMTAPVTAIIAYDLRFYEKQPKLAPNNPQLREQFLASPTLVETTARRNSSLQGAYFIIAARALGLDCGPMSGFDNAKVDAEFFAAGKASPGFDQEFLSQGHLRSNFLCNVGYGDPAQLRPRQARLAFEEACSLL
ncbi:MAG TPA: malonic semialdehyde reductase [Vicinamibacterales bacterium]|nr:malonic semialdehyde reductase [Vicinamibacterales bacterium]